MSPSHTVARRLASFPAVVAMILVLAAPAQLRAQTEADWVGKRVVPKAGNFVLRIDDEPVEPSRQAIAIYRVERADDGTSLWLTAEGRRLSGSAKIDEVIPVERAIDSYTEQIHAHPQDAFAYAMRALVRQDKGELDAALRDYDRAIRLDPKNAPLYGHRGDVRASLEHYDQAIADYDEAIRLDPRFALAYSRRGVARAIQKDYDKAIADYSEAIWLEPLSISAYGNRGLAWYSRKEYEKAVVDFNKVIRLDPENALAYTRRALAWKALKAYAKAVADSSEALRLDPRQPDAWNSLAGIRAACPDEEFRDGRKAVESATRACELAGWKNAAYLATLAAAHAEAGDFDAAVKWQARANALHPGGEDKIRGEARLEFYRGKKPYRETDP